MEVNFYNKLDPRRLLGGSFKNLASLAPRLVENGEQVTINSNDTESAYNGIIPVHRDLVVSGRIKTSFILHGNINVTLKNADLTNAPNAVNAIALASDFTGALAIVNSKIHINANVPGQGYGIITELGSDSGQRALEVDLINSQVEGIGVMPIRMNISGKNVITSTSQRQGSVINCTKMITENAEIVASNLILMQASDKPTYLNKLTVASGPVTLEGKWQIGEININANRQSQELLKLVGQHFTSQISIKKITITKSPRGISIVYAENSELIFQNAVLGSEKTQYAFAIKGCVIHMKETTDYLKWLITDKNVLDLDEASLTSLRTQKDKFFTRIQPKKPVAVKKGDLPKMNNDDNSQPKDSNDQPTDKTSNNVANQNSKSNIVNSSGMDKLKQLIGLKEVKQKVKDYINTSEINRELSARGLTANTDMARHMVFSGNPGTGKTTVAEDLGQVLHEKGALRTGIVKSFPSDKLIGDVVGATAKATKEAIKESLGGIMFIDEAYMLDGSANGNSFAPEAVGALIQGMDAHRDDLIVIFAGYTNKMRHFLDHANPGLRSRIGDNWINFPDYTSSEKLQIFDLLMRKKGGTMNNSFKNTDKFKENMIYFNRDHSNGRSVRNYVDALIRKRNTRNMNYCIKNHLKLKDLSNEQLTAIIAMDVLSVWREWHQKQAEKKKMEQNDVLYKRQKDLPINHQPQAKTNNPNDLKANSSNLKGEKPHDAK